MKGSKLISLIKRNVLIAGLAAAAVALLAGGGAAAAITLTSSSGPAATTVPAGSYAYVCLTPAGQVRWFEMSQAPHTCAGGGQPQRLAQVVAASIKSATVNASGDLTLTFTDGATMDAGHVAGKDGTNGINGTSYTPVTATYVTTIIKDPDSGLNGNWATDDFSRTFTVLRHNAVPAGNCGATAANGVSSCWFYTATMTDTGTFTTIAGANEPLGAATAINGTLSGTITGAATYEFYASASAPDTANPLASLVATSGTDSSNWPTRFFADGTHFGEVNENTYSYNYVAPTTCETMIQASTGNTGNITGVNACKS